VDSRDRRSGADSRYDRPCKAGPPGNAHISADIDNAEGVQRGGGFLCKIACFKRCLI
jgi:hypothetical protein